MTEPIDPIELYIDRKVLDDFSVAVLNLEVAMTPRGGAAVEHPRRGKVARMLSVALTQAQTAALWLNAAEDQALHDAKLGQFDR